MNPWTDTMQKTDWNKGEQNIKENSKDFKDLGAAQKKSAVDILSATSLLSEHRSAHPSLLSLWPSMSVTIFLPPELIYTRR